MYGRSPTSEGSPLPANLFIIGMPRAATTSMAAWLATHPDIFLSHPKEPGYWITDLPMKGRITTPEAYAACFAGATTERYRLDATPWYFYSPAALRSIAQSVPDARIVVQLRDPVSQLASLHNHHVFKNIESQRDIAAALWQPRPDSAEDFRRGLDYLDAGAIGQHIDRVLEHFPVDNVHFVDFERIRAAPREAHIELLEALDIAPIEAPMYRRLNPSRQVRSVAIQSLTNRLTSRTSLRPVQALRHRIHAANTIERQPGPPAHVARRIAAELSDDIDRLDKLLGRNLRSRGRV